MHMKTDLTRETKLMMKELIQRIKTIEILCVSKKTLRQKKKN